MRVITGTARGRKLKTLEGLATRPTMEVVKEAVFSIIHFRLPYAKVLDLFAGSGQMGIESLSRGAEKAVFVDNSKAALDVIRENIDTVGFGKQSQVVSDDAVSFLNRTKENFDVIFLDPPYDAGFVSQVMPLLGKHLTPDGIVLFEHRKGEEMPEAAGGLTLKKRYIYGKTAVTTYVKASPEAD